MGGEEMKNTQFAEVDARLNCLEIGQEDMKKELFLIRNNELFHVQMGIDNLKELWDNYKEYIEERLTNLNKKIDSTHSMVKFGFLFVGAVLTVLAIIVPLIMTGVIG